MTRKERGRLLFVSIISLIISNGYIPTKISSLGLEFDTQPDTRFLLLILTGITTYYLLAFVLYLSSDTYLWKKRINSAVRDDEIIKLEIHNIRNTRLITDFTFLLNSLRNKEKRTRLIDTLNGIINYERNGEDIGGSRRGMQSEELQLRINRFNNEIFEMFFKNRWRNIMISNPLSGARVLIDLLLPIALALYSILCLLLLAI